MLDTHRASKILPPKRTLRDTIPFGLAFKGSISSLSSSTHQRKGHMTPPDLPSETTVRHPREGLITLAHVIYALHAFSVFTGLASSVLILTAFLTGWPSIIAVILNYAKRSEVRGTWLDSHFGWQIRTFWYACVWLLVGVAAFFTGVGIPVAIVVWFVTGLWVLYRIARGFVTLSREKPMPLQSVV